MMNKIIRRLKSNPDYDPGKIYLLKKTSASGGFFLYDNKLAFAYENCAQEAAHLATAFLELLPGVHIKSIVNCPTFAEGEYDFLTLKTETKDIVDDFVRLCNLYEQDGTIPFAFFVTKMFDLFRPKSTTSKLNAIGLFGELSLIVEAGNAGQALYTIWHKEGPKSRFDFASDVLNLEVKTSTGESNSFVLKHSQIFGLNRPIVCIIKLIKDDNSKSLSELLEFVKAQEPYASDFRFQLALKAELNKDYDEDAMNQRFEIEGYYFFDCNSLETIRDIPPCITAITYNYEFDLEAATSFGDFVSTIKL